MRPDLQAALNERVTEKSYNAFKQRFNEWLGFPIEYRVAEVPIIVSNNFRKQLESAASEVIAECIKPEILAHSLRTIEPQYDVPNCPDRPLFSVADFAVTRRHGDKATGRHGDGEWEPKLIELQGFPSLFGYQYALASRYQEEFGSNIGSMFLGSLSEEQYLSTLKRAIFGERDPETVCLVELDPEVQKTRPDFVALERFIGLKTVNIRNVYKEGRKLIARTENGTFPIERVFNRAIVDELVDEGVQLNFSWTDDLDIEWAGHPNWYFKISKFLLPYLKHPTVPESVFVSELTRASTNPHFVRNDNNVPHLVRNDSSSDAPLVLSTYVLKPLYSFAGKGVNLNPTAADIDAIPEDQRANWVLQKKVEYDACIPTPYGPNKAEIRIMMVWFPDEPAPLPIMSLVRMGRGMLMGARYNTDPWTGSSAALFV